MCNHLNLPCKDRVKNESSLRSWQLAEKQKQEMRDFRKEVFSIDNTKQFEEITLALFRYQSENVNIYAEFLKGEQRIEK